MYRVRGSSSNWRATLQYLRQDFHLAAEAFPNLRHAIIRAIDEEETIPPSLEREMHKAGGWSELELRSRWELAETAKDLTKPTFLVWLTLNSPAKRGYLIGKDSARKKFEFLAKRAWLALPGTRNGKAEGFPQRREVERWLAFVYAQLEHASSSYLSVEDELVVCEDTTRGRRVEHRFAPRLGKDGDIVSTCYSDATGPFRRARRWTYTALGTDPFTASAVAIDVKLADRTPEGSFLVSEKEFDALAKCEESNFVVDVLNLGEGRMFPIYRDWCKPAPGSTPSLCPNADPPADEASRKKMVVFLPKVARLFRDLKLIGTGQTIHWVGRQASLGTCCTCNLNSGDRKTCSATRPPMTPDQRLVFGLLDSLPPGEAMTGAEIIGALRNEKEIEQSTLTSRIIPFLKKHYGVKNKRGAGYYIDKGA